MLDGAIDDEALDGAWLEDDGLKVVVVPPAWLEDEEAAAKAAFALWEADGAAEVEDGSEVAWASIEVETAGLEEAGAEGEEVASGARDPDWDGEEVGAGEEDGDGAADGAEVGADDESPVWVTTVAEGGVEDAPPVVTGAAEELTWLEIEVGWDCPSVTKLVLVWPFST